MDDANRQAWEEAGFNVVPCRHCDRETVTGQGNTSTCSECRQTQSA